VVAVGVEQVETSGRLSRSFDGNDTSALISWLFPMPGTRYSPPEADDLALLLDWTVNDHLAWCVFPVDNALAGSLPRVRTGSGEFFS
jgi:hypothetical protein